MDSSTVVALATTGVTALSVGLSAWSTRWTARNTRSMQREERGEQRKATAYLRILEHAEAEGRYQAIRLHNWEMSVDDEYEIAVFRAAPKPEKDERSTSVAQVAAFGSTEVRSAHTAWLAAHDEVVTALENLDFNANENYGPGHPIVEREVLPLRAAVQNETARRNRLADVINADLGQTGA